MNTETRELDASDREELLRGIKELLDYGGFKPNGATYRMMSGAKSTIEAQAVRIAELESENAGSKALAELGLDPTRAMKETCADFLQKSRIAADAERDRIVAWLKEDLEALRNSRDAVREGLIAEAIEECADAISRNEHRDT